MKVLIGVDSLAFNKVTASFINSHNWKPRTTFRVVHVIEPALVHETDVSFLPLLNELVESEKKASHELVQDLAQQIKVSHLDSPQIITEVIEGHAGDRLIQIAQEWPADLLLVGSHGRKGLTRFAMGSVSSAIVSIAPCSVIVLKLPKGSSSEPAKNAASMSTAK
ncbi:MAG: universal stress protein [Candidatus Melainabacteria bacterium]|nr:MAG: universal stress protein [Candidatus Melainabacteria bacterium]